MRHPDQQQRDRMRAALDANVAVRAAAGSGKTRSTVDRIVGMALHPDYLQYLPQLIVVTYTNAAADELRTRARKRLIEEHHDELTKLAGKIIPKFGQIFFGTIHSFCMRILREFGHQIGLPWELESIEEQVDEIHEQFRREREDETWDSLDRREALRVFRFGLSFENLVQIGKELSMLPVDCSELLRLPEMANYDVVGVADRLKLDPAALDHCKFRANAQTNGTRYQQKYREFCRSWNSGGNEGSFVSMLMVASKGGAELKECSETVLMEVHDWYARSILKLGLSFAARFQDFRREKGCLTYNDQIRLASSLIATPAVLRTLRGRNFRVILDEAQDTTPEQFRILSEIARPIDAQGEWLTDRSSMGPRPGHFVMVGDEQQCIYASSGAEIECYAKHGGALESIVFHVTFRCSRTVVRFVNERFPRILHGQGGQAEFVELVAKHDAEQGGIGRIELKGSVETPPGRKKTDAVLFDKEMELLAREIKKLGPEGLGARHWSDIAVLMPWNEWLNTLAGHLERAGVPFRLTARRKNRSAVGWRWFTALLLVLSGRDDGYELAGVLREIYGVSDAELAEWVFLGGKLSLRASCPGGPAQPADSSRVGEVLKRLQRLARRMEAMPALLAVEEMLSETGTAAKLSALRDVRHVNRGPDSLWNMLRGAAAKAESEGISWKELALELAARKDRDLPELLSSEDRDSMVLMTCQKAKGQEWPVVLLAGLSRPMRVPSSKKAAVEILRTSGLACRVKGVRTRNWRKSLETHEAQREHQLRRIYYVACTRAKRHLIFADARGLWQRDSKLTRPIQALSAIDETDAWFGKLDLWRASSVDRQAARAGREAVGLAADLKSVARLGMPKVSHPSRLDEDRSISEIEQQEERDERELRVEPLHGALIYGDWWHETMRASDWSEKQTDSIWSSAMSGLPEGPLRERAASELEVLEGSELIKELRAAREFHRELPYARRPEPRGIEDGKIDLLYLAADGRWMLVDWKTDKVKDEAEAAKRAKQVYAAQIAAYTDALRSFGIEVAEARLYFTAIGRAVPID